MKKVLVITENSDCELVGEYVNSSLREMRINSDVVTIDSVLENRTQLKKLINKVVRYSNIIIVPKTFTSKNKSMMTNFLKELINVNGKEAKTKFLSVILNHNSKKTNELVDELNLYNKLSKSFGAKWQKGVAIDIGREKLKKLEDDIVLELDFLCSDIKNDSIYHDFMFLESKLKKGLINKLKRICDYVIDMRRKFINSEKAVN